MYRPRYLVSTKINPEIIEIFYKNEEIARTCFHESGHGIIHIFFGGRVNCLIVNTDGSGSTSGDMRPFSADVKKHDMLCMAGFFFESLICGRYNFPFPLPYLAISPDVVNTYEGDTDKVINELERLVILNDYIVTAVEETAVRLFRSGLRINEDTILEIWIRSSNGRTAVF